MSWITVYIVFQLIIVIGAILLGYFIFDKRYKNNEDIIPDGFNRTDEVSIDPISGERRRVYFHPETGERFYKLEVTK